MWWRPDRCFEAYSQWDTNADLFSRKVASGKCCLSRSAIQFEFRQIIRITSMHSPTGSETHANLHPSPSRGSTSTAEPWHLALTPGCQVHLSSPTFPSACPYVGWRPERLGLANRITLIATGRTMTEGAAGSDTWSGGELLFAGGTDFAAVRPSCNNHYVGPHTAENMSLSCSGALVQHHSGVARAEQGAGHLDRLAAFSRTCTQLAHRPDAASAHCRLAGTPLCGPRRRMTKRQRCVHIHTVCVCPCTPYAT